MFLYIDPLKQGLKQIKYQVHPKVSNGFYT